MTKIENVPDELCSPPGVIGDVARYVLATCQRKHPEFGLSTGLAIVSVITGRKVVDETGTTANLYLLNLGSTGSGKDQYRKTLKKILQAESLLSSERFTSDSAFINELMDRPSMLCVCDEVGSMVEDLNNQRASSHVKNLADAMTQSYTSAGSVWNYKGFADGAKTKTVSHPNFVLYGSGNALTLFKALRPEKVSDGFIGRFTMLLSENGGGQSHKLARLAKDRNKPGADEFSPLLPVPESIVAFIAKWKAFKTHDGNLESLCPEPHVVERSPEAAERLQSHFEEIHERGCAEVGTIRGDLWARASEKSAKFALLSALSRSSDLIEIADANWGITLSNFLTRRLIKMCSRHIAETPWDMKRLEILRRIQDNGRPVEHSDLLKSSRVKSKEFQEFISNLMECGDIVFAVKATKGRSATGYAASGSVFDKHSGWKIVTAEEIKNASKK
jgi:hypothetical protein